ncbi:antirestriction protein [Salmonella enterica subsp. enterica]|nr:hypothetical protein [Salmonella enterica]EDT6693513.1 antirestriction protein [Salmonella enterica subsp. enterica serovar Gbadago]EGK3403594.1 antirestriction protein [Salmonella enterica]
MDNVTTIDMQPVPFGLVLLKYLHTPRRVAPFFAWAKRLGDEYDEFGITLSLFALGQIANTTEEDSDILLYHALRDYALEHSESVEIMAAID